MDLQLYFLVSIAVAPWIFVDDKKSVDSLLVKV